MGSRWLFVITFGFGAILGMVVPAACGGELRLSGILCQTQDSGKDSLPGIGMKGAACDTAGRLWSYSGGYLYCFRADGNRWTLSHKIAAKGNMDAGPGGLYRYNDLLVYAGGNGNIFHFDPASGQTVNSGKLPPGTVAFALASDGMSCSYLALADNKIMQRTTLADNPWTELFTLPVLKAGKYQSLAFDSADGTIWVGSSWPDCTVRGFCRNGIQNKTPRTAVNVSALAVQNEHVWALHNGAAPLSMKSGLNRISENPWYGHSSGLANMSDGSWWLATGQGLLHFDTQMKSLDQRLGGISGPSLLSVGTDGTLVAYDSYRMLCLSIDDKADTPLKCNGMEAFRCGANWSSHPCAMVFDGNCFLVLDDKAKKIWTFDPRHIESGRKTWLSLTPDNKFKRPKSLAYNGSQLFVADEEGIVMRVYPGIDNFVPSGITENGLLAANADEILVVAANNRISAYKFDSCRHAALFWQKTFADRPIIAMAAGKNLLAIGSDAELQLVSVVDGHHIASLKNDDVPGGMNITAVTVFEPWIFVGDSKGRRILRFRYEKSAK